MRSFWAVLLLCLTYLGVFFLFLPWLCRSWPYSKFFSSDPNNVEIVRQILNENNLRISIAQDFLRSYIKKTASAEEPVDLVVAVITINRDSDSVGQLGYLTQTVARVLSVIQNDHSEIFRNKIVFICNVDAKGSQHSEAVYLSKVVTVVSRFPNGTVGSERQENFNIFEKEKSDYVFCLRKAYSYNPHYILMMEDDVLLNYNSFTTLTHLLRSRVDPHEDDPISWLFTKLYYPEKWQGYAYEPDKVGELIGIALLGGTVLALIAFKLYNRRCTTKTHISVLFVVGAMTSTVMAVLIGRPYIRSWRRFSPYTHRLVRAPDCCTQAVLYPTSVVEGLAEYLSEVVSNIDFSVDLAIDAFAHEHGLRRHLVEPNLCRHIGFVSTIRSYAKKAAEFLE